MSDPYEFANRRVNELHPPYHVFSMFAIRIPQAVRLEMFCRQVKVWKERWS